MFPVEIWHLFVDELVAREDGVSLVHLARTCRTLADVTLPRLYRICRRLVKLNERSYAGKRAMLWRSIILSAEGKMAFPYCLWLPTLSFSDLGILLGEVWKDYFADRSLNICQGLHPLFFGGDMKPYDFVSRSLGLGAYHKAVKAKAGKTITHFIKKAVEGGQHTASATTLLVPYDMLDMVPDLVAHLPTLEELEYEDTTSLDAGVASAIRDHCPRFRRLAIFVDEVLETQISSFLRTLRPGSLEVFKAAGWVEFRNEALEALSTHATSLKLLELSIAPSTLPHLGVLRQCTSVERLDFFGPRIPWAGDGFCEGAARRCQRFFVNGETGQDLSDKDRMVNWMDGASFTKTTAWLSACASLSSLTLMGISNCGPLLRIALRSPSLRLRYLHVVPPEPCSPEDESDACFLESLHHQTALEVFTFGWRTEGEFGWSNMWYDDNDSLYEADIVEFDNGLYKPGSPVHALLMQALCQCTRLRELCLLETVLTVADLDRLAASLPNLETFIFDSNTSNTDLTLRDEALDALWGMRKLRTVCADCPTQFSKNAMKDYLLAVSVARPHMSITLGGVNQYTSGLRWALLRYAKSLGVHLVIETD